MHKVFGVKEKAEYVDREGAYLIPVHNNEIAVIKTDKGYFLLGGGLDKNESHEDCIKRECIEETGYTAVIKEKICSAETYTTHPKLGYFHPIQSYYIGDLKEKASEPTETDHILMWVKYDDIKGKMFAEMQNWALEQCAEKLKGGDSMNQNEYWNSVAEEKKFTTVLDVELFSKYVSKDYKILDIGCGYGRILNELAEAGFTDLTGIDSAENMIKRGLREYPNLNLVANPDGAIPFEDNSFDAVILFGVLTCVPDNESQKELLNNIKKVLKPGGIVYINDFLLNSGFKRWLFYKKSQKKTGIYGAFKTYDGATVRHHAEDYILKLLSDFKTLDYKKFVIPTMNGNKSNSFGFIGELNK